MAECTGNEIIEEMLYHFGMLDMKDEVLAHSHNREQIEDCVIVLLRLTEFYDKIKKEARAST